MPVLGNCFSLHCTSSTKGLQQLYTPTVITLYNNIQLYTSMPLLELYQWNLHRSKHEEETTLGFSVAEVVANFSHRHVLNEISKVLAMKITVQGKTSSFILLTCKEREEIRTQNCSCKWVLNNKINDLLKIKYAISNNSVKNENSNKAEKLSELFDQLFMWHFEAITFYRNANYWDHI